MLKDSVKGFSRSLWKNHKGVIIILSILIIQLSLSLYQYSRYDIDNYCCRHMARDCERFFESLGINTYMVSGAIYKNQTNKTPENIDTAHVWLLLDFGFVCIPFESTVLLFFFDPPYWEGYEELKISEGYITHGRINDELEWNKWL